MIDLATAITVIDDFEPDLAPLIASEILERSGVPTFGSTNVGGWKSSEALFEWSSAPAIGALRNALLEVPPVRDLAMACRLVGWAMINREGSYHRRHVHAGRLVGIYYAMPGDPPVPTIFDVGTVEAAGTSRSIDPVTGRLVLFAPGIWHRVPVYHGTQPRITIAIEMRPL